jgi:hypothetical protein
MMGIRRLLLECCMEEDLLPTPSRVSPHRHHLNTPSHHMDHSCLEQDHDSLVRLQGHLEQVKRIKQDNDLKTIAVVELKKKVNELLGERERMATAFVAERDMLQSKEREASNQLLELGTRLAAAEDALRTTREELHGFQLASAEQVNGALRMARRPPVVPLTHTRVVDCWARAFVAS